MKYETPNAVVSSYWDDPLDSSYGGSITTPEDEFDQAIYNAIYGDN